jgi:hypothetical protein
MAGAARPCKHDTLIVGAGDVTLTPTAHQSQHQIPASQ